jgi:cell division protein FtsQ
VGNGELLSAVTTQAAPDVPILVGEMMEKNLELRKRSVQILGEIPEEGSFSRKAISDLHFHPKEGFWVRLVNNKIHVNLGEDGMRMKSRRVSEVLDYINTHNFQARVIDANLSKKVLVRLRKDP